MGVGAFTTNLFVCMLTNAAADYKTDTSLKRLLSTLDLPGHPNTSATVALNVEPAAAAAAATAAAASISGSQIQSRLPATGDASSSSSSPSSAATAAAASSLLAAHDIPSSLIICPATSPNALAIAS